MLDPDTKIINRKDMKARRQQLRHDLSTPEVILWSKIRNRQLDGYRFRRQHGFAHYVVDFYCPQAKLAIEVDGDSHGSENAIEYDQSRQDVIESEGVRFLRFTNHEVTHNLDGVIQKIITEIQNPLHLPLEKGER